MTVLLLTFGAALLLAVLTSSLASRSPLSTTGVFLAAGIVTGPLVLDLVDVSTPNVELAAEVALFVILFTDGQHAPWSVLRRHWNAPARALLLGMPISLLVVAALGHWVAGLPWASALVLGAILAPTDPVFASALVGREDVPKGVRHLLNIESGLNDGLALLAVLVLVGVAGGDPEGWSTDPWILLLELGVGIVLGVVLPLLVDLVLRLPGVESIPSLRPLGVIAVAVLLYGVCELVHANQFLAAFVAGATIATLRPRVSESFRETGELVSELAKGGALIAFAGLLEPELFLDAGWTALVVALLVVAISRPLPILAVLPGSGLDRRARIAVAWFGPKGFASVAYGVIVASSGIPDADEVLAIVTVTVLVSVLAHSTTDVVVANWLRPDPERDRPALDPG
ncbi:cation:proton antiporter [Nocardioides sp. SYSU DS0663]|uniref:cation:proton antiporter n=1 Tax=Nocardioides sp. SYSU DS0663 TaxID=3416445 RepID=UPI003F4B514D